MNKLESDNKVLRFVTMDILYPIRQHFTAYIAGPGQALIADFITLPLHYLD